MTWPQYLRRECTFNGTVIVSLTPKEVEMLLVMLMRRPAPITADDMVEMVYRDPEAEPEWPVNVLRVLMSRLRKKLPGAIECRPTIGYTVP